MLADQPPLAIDENMVDSSQTAISIGAVRDDAIPNARPSPTQSFYQEGYHNSIGEWGTCFSDVNAEGLRTNPQGIYSDNTSHLFHGYGYAPDVTQRPYSSYLPSVSHHGHFSNGLGLPGADHAYYQHIASQCPIPQNKFPVKDLQGDSSRYRPRAGYSSTWGSFGGGSNFSQNSQEIEFLRQHFEGFERGGLWSDCSKPVNGRSSSVHYSSTCPKSTGSMRLSVNHLGTTSLQNEPYYGFGSRSGSSHKSFTQGQSDRDPSHEIISSFFGMNNGQNWPTLDEARRGGINDFPCTCATLDTLSERNRGPRAFRPRTVAMTNASAVDNCRKSVADVSHNRLDFVTDYEDAKFFIIKSYSEDNVHKSIKYGVWASTQNGNKKLDAAYHDAKDKNGMCPVFLLFSVNASAQFCGVAEMVGPVDFDKSVDYWQQDKWSGQFPVKWHIIKDVPNSQFRHIVLENNDNKPVTNSRDTQEVELEQGAEMLKIFKNYESCSSILDDFHFYEERQKAMQARKSRHQVNLVSAPAVGVSNEQQNSVSLSHDLINKMSKSFAEAVSVNENGRKLSLSHLPHGAIGEKPEK